MVGGLPPPPPICSRRLSAWRNANNPSGLQALLLIRSVIVSRLRLEYRSNPRVSQLASIAPLYSSHHLSSLMTMSDAHSKFPLMALMPNPTHSVLHASVSALSISHRIRSQTLFTFIGAALRCPS